MSVRKGENIGELLKRALVKLNQTEHYDEYMAYLNSEWYYTPYDLRLARDDEKLWSEIKFPGRLKIELSALLDESVPVANHGAEGATKVQFNESQNTTSTFEVTIPEVAGTEETNAENSTWVKCWAAEHECYYFYNTATQESSWEDPHGGDENAVYDVYQYNEDSQEWVVIEDNTSANYAGWDVDADGNYIENISWSGPAETKDDGSFKKNTSEDKQSDESVTFTKPRDLHPESQDSVLFTMSPNRPGAKGTPASMRRDEAKSMYKDSGSNRNNEGAAPSNSSPVKRAPARKPRTRPVKPIRLDVSTLSDDSCSDNDSPNKPNFGGKVIFSDSDKRPSPMHSKPMGHREQHHSPQGPAAAAPPRLADNKNLPTKQYDWDSKNDQTLDSVDPADIPTTTDEPYDFYKDYLESAVAEDYDNEDPDRMAYGAYADPHPDYSDYPEQEQADHDHFYTEEENAAYYGASYVESAKTECDPHHTGGPELDAYYHDYREDKNDTDQHYAEHFLESLTNPNIYDQRDPNYPHSNGNGNGDGPASAKTEQEMIEESYYHHAATPTAPVVAAERHDKSHMIGLPTVGPSTKEYTPNGRPRRYSNDEKSSSSDTEVTYATPVPDNEPLGDNYFLVATSMDDQPITPGGSNNINLMEMAMGTPLSTGNNTRNNTPHGGHRTPERKPKSTLSKLFHLNLFGSKAPSTPPPPRNNDHNNDRTHASNPHSSAYRQARQEERQAAKRAASNTHGGGTYARHPHPEDAAIAQADVDYNHAARRGEHHDLERRRKPAPSSMDSESSVASRDKFYAAHGQESPYKYQHQLNQLQQSNRTGGGGGGSSNKSQRPGQTQEAQQQHLRNMQKLMDMGFDEEESIFALTMCGESLSDATQMLVESRD